MKKYFNIFLLSLVALTSMTMMSCKNETDEIFDDDAVTRLENAKDNFINILTDKGGKWQMQYYSNSNEPGYVYVMTFRTDGSVTISGKNIWIGKVEGESLDVPTYGSQTSLWDVITDNGPVLSFNSFNKYFHVFADPEDIPSMSDEDTDETGYGHEGDYEFDLMKYSGDTLYITGKKYGIDMIMTRLDAGIDDHVYMDEVVAMADSFFNAKIPQVYMNLPNGTRWIIKNGATSILKMFREGDDEISTSVNHNVIITHDGLSFMNPLTVDGYTVQNFIRQADGSLLCRDDNETTITADDLNMVFTIPTFKWKFDLTQMGGVLADQLELLRTDLNNYGKRKLSAIDISYNTDLGCYLLDFSCVYQKKTLHASFYFNAELVGENQIKFNFTGEGNDVSVVYAEKCPAFNSFIAAMNGVTYTLTTSSQLAPVDMKVTDSSNGANYFQCRL
ncbi:MAG: DUF4302 domain-containing protein [Bacteroidales bacterium]|nr:DUF4302 domain-containing protein [Bacteroidales bacterium]